MRFDLTDLQLCLNVHEAGTITAGAARSHMTLASASERIRGMESALGVPLMTRDRRGVTMTAAGRTLVHHARQVLQQMEHLRGDLSQYGHGLAGHVRLLCNTAALTEFLPDMLGSFLLRYPRISVDLEERVSFDIADALRTGLCDLGIVANSTDLQGLQTHSLCHDPLVLVVPRDHPLAGARAIGLAEVTHLDFVGLGEGSALQDHVNHHARRLGKTLSYRIRLRSVDAVCRMVGKGVGVGIVPHSTAVRCARAAGIRRLTLTDSWAPRDLVLCVRDATSLPGYVRQLMAHILEEAQAPGRPSSKQAQR